MKYDLIIFDMDGTILDTLDDLKDSLNYALRKSSLPERSKEEVRTFVGNGIRKLIERGVPENSSIDIIDEVYRNFSEHYKNNCCNKTKPYKGIIELLKKLKELGYKTAVVSNKADYAVKDLCTQFFDDLFCCSVGEREGIRRKPAPDSVFEVMSKLGTDKNKSLYIGDSDVDINTAKNAGIDAIAVEWGFRDRKFLAEHGAETIIASPEEVLEFI